MEPVIKKLLRTLDNVMEHVDKVRPLATCLRTTHAHSSTYSPPLLNYRLLTYHLLTRLPPTRHPNRLSPAPLTSYSPHQAGVGSTDPAILRLLQDVVASAPRMPAVQFNQMFNSQVQDMLVVVYLANLTRTQLALAEKLQSVALSSGGGQ